MKKSLFKRLAPLIALPFIIVIIGTGFLIGCSTSQQTTTYNALQSIELTADTTYSNYVAQVVKGTISTNALPAVSKAYNDLHAAIAVATTLDQAGTNVLASTNLTSELTSFVNLAATAIANK